MCFTLSFILLIALFLEKFTPLVKFYTAAGSDGIDKSHLCCDHPWNILRRSEIILVHRRSSDGLLIAVYII